MAPKSRERDFDKIGGLEEHIQALKEMIIYPLLYRELFDAYGIEAPRGVLFHGPPGTGKTLTAGAVAAECSKSINRRVSFYMRKGADCLNKYVGESEKHLQNLFSQAQNTRPSIIFFDEIDGLVPTRSESQEQVHASVVSTLLALMDGLDSKSEVFVIGATNRIDMIDPALRRPGRFDRELYFPLPPLESRLQIFRIHTRSWKHKPSQNLISKLASECTGYCGADIQSLCAQAVMKSFHRHFPQVSDTSKKYSVNLRNIRVEDEDFWEAKESVVPASQRTYILPSRPLNPELEPLFRRCLDKCLDHIHRTCPFKFLFRNREDFLKNKSLSCPRFLLVGNKGQGHITHLAPAILHCFDHLPVVLIDLSTISEDSSRSTDSSSVIRKIEEARQSMPSIVYFRDMSSWWGLIDENARQVLVDSIESLDTSNVCQIFLFGTVCGSSYEDLIPDIKKLFPKSKLLTLPEPTKQERTRFFAQLLLERILLPPKVKRGKSFAEVDYGSLSNLGLEGDNERRRSLRLKGLVGEHLGLTSGNKPRLGSYYRKYVNKPEVSRTTRTEPAFKGRKIAFDDFCVPLMKKPKVEASSDNNSDRSKAAAPEVAPPLNTSQEKVEAVKVDVGRLEKLTDSAAEATASCSVSSIIRLYEELEIVGLRFATKLDRSALPEEMEQEIAVFVPT